MAHFEASLSFCLFVFWSQMFPYQVKLMPQRHWLASAPSPGGHVLSFSELLKSGNDPQRSKLISASGLKLFVPAVKLGILTRESAGNESALGTPPPKTAVSGTSTSQRVPLGFYLKSFRHSYLYPPPLWAPADTSLTPPNGCFLIFIDLPHIIVALQQVNPGFKPSQDPSGCSLHVSLASGQVFSGRSGFSCNEEGNAKRVLAVLSQRSFSSFELPVPS